MPILRLAGDQRPRMRAVEGASRLAGAGSSDFVFAVWEEIFCLRHAFKVRNRLEAARTAAVEL